MPKNTSDILVPHERRIQLIDGITDESYQAFSDKLYQLETKSNKSITIELMSYGGSAYAALAFASRIRRCKNHITVVAYGMVASAAVLVLAAGHTRSMTKESWCMVHEDQGKIKGNLNTLEKETKHMRRLEDQWAELLCELTLTSKSKWAKLHKDETYLNAQECLKLGLVDFIV